MNLIAIGIIRSPHGVKGFLKTRSFSGETGHFLSLKEIYVEKNARLTLYKVEQIKQAGREVLIKLAGVDSPEQGKFFSNCTVFSERKNASVLKEGEFYHADLCKCVLLSGGKTIGKVISVWNNGHNDYLEIKPEKGSTFMVPFMKQFTGAVNLEKHTIELLDEDIIP